MKLNHILAASVASMLMAPDAGGGTATATAPATGAKTSPAAKTDGKASAKPEAKVHTGLQTAIKNYDDACASAESYFIEIVETIQKENISRADVVQTLMKARGITFETAQTQYSRMKGIWQNPDVLAKLKSGEMSLRMAREVTKKTQAGTEAKAAAAAAGSGAGAGDSKETKEARYERTQKAHVAAVKECGFDRKSALTSFEANLKAAGVQ